MRPLIPQLPTQRHAIELVFGDCGAPLLPGFGEAAPENVKLVLVRGVSGGVILVSATAAGLILLLASVKSAPPKARVYQSIPTKPTARVAGFDIKGESKVVSQSGSAQKLLRTVMSAGGPMHTNEILRFEGQCFIQDASGKEIPLSDSKWTFAEQLVSEVPVPSGLIASSKVILRGKVYVYRREEIKVERDVQPDKSVKLYMNTGWVYFKNVTTPQGKRVQVTCKDLKSVHEHALELVSKDKKTVSGRIMLTPGDQIIDRESIPYQGVNVGLEPINVRQLLPKRAEPVALAIPISGL